MAPLTQPFPEHHEWLLSEAVDILPFLLLPLAGPEDLPEHDMERKWVPGWWGCRGGPVSPTEGACPQGCPRTCSTCPRTSSARRSPTLGGCCWKPSCWWVPLVWNQVGPREKVLQGGGGSSWGGGGPSLALKPVGNQARPVQCTECCCGGQILPMVTSSVLGDGAERAHGTAMGDAGASRGTKDGMGRAWWGGGGRGWVVMGDPGDTDAVGQGWVWGWAWGWVQGFLPAHPALASPHSSRPRGPGGAGCGTWAPTWCCGSCTAGSSTPGCGRPASACCR